MHGASSSQARCAVLFALVCIVLTLPCVTAARADSHAKIKVDGIDGDIRRNFRVHLGEISRSELEHPATVESRIARESVIAVASRSRSPGNPRLQ